jgi:Tol biopolymer transport system component
MAPAVRAVAILAATALTLLPTARGAGVAQIAFTELDATKHADIVLMNADGTGRIDLTPGQQNSYDDDRSPSWAPDGLKLAFTSHRDGPSSQEIYVMNADGTSPHRLTTDTGTGAFFNVDPAWSPDGKKIAWRKAGRNSTDEIWVMNADGTGQKRLTTDGGTKTAPKWSPDSTRLLYTRQAGMTQAFVVDAAGGTPRALTPQGVADSGPSWSPDGTRIAVDRNDKIWVLGADGTGGRMVAATIGLGPIWAPDGSKIAFTGTRFFPQFANRFGTPSRSDIFVVTPNGTDEQRLTGPLGDDAIVGPSFGAPSWWPDGSRLFFSPGGATWMMNADGSCEGPFGAATQRLEDPAFRPGMTGLPPRISCADLRVTVAASADAVGLKQTVVLHVQVDNDGDLAASGLKVRIAVPAGVSITGSLPGCTRTTAFVCTLPPLPAGLSTSFEVYVSSARAGLLKALVSASSDQAESDPSNNSTEADTTVLPCTTVGTLGNDAINGTAGRDLICARAGWDRINALGGNDVVDAGSGNDTIDAGKGRDKVMGGDGADVILVHDGERDTVDCGSGTDVVLADPIDVVAKNCEQVIRY